VLNKFPFFLPPFEAPRVFWKDQARLGFSRSLPAGEVPSTPVGASVATPRSITLAGGLPILLHDPPIPRRPFHPHPTVHLNFLTPNGSRLRIYRWWLPLFWSFAIPCPPTVACKLVFSPLHGPSADFDQPSKFTFICHCSLVLVQVQLLKKRPRPIPFWVPAPSF